MAAMHKALIFSDPHITSPGETIIGLDPLARFRDAYTHALSRHADAEQIILLGDLSHNGAPEEYSRLADVLRSCPIPVTATMGNHDRPVPFAKAFPEAVNRDGFAQNAVDLGPLRLLILDTFDYDGRAPLDHDGWLCEARLAWLDRELQRARDDGRDVVLFGHHPPCPVGFWAMDAIGLANAEDLLARATASESPVRHMICGHVHRTIHASARGLPITVLKSTCHQMPMALGPGTSADSVDEPGAYGILLALDGTVVVHTEDFALSTGEVARYTP